MNILLDFLPFQVGKGIGGAASYAKAVSDEVCLRCGQHDKLFAAYNARLPKGGQYDYEEYALQHDIQLLDLSASTLSQYVSTHAIDREFIALGQFYQDYPLEGIGCRVIMGIHDIWHLERDDTLVELTIKDSIAESRWRWTKRILNTVSGRFRREQKKLYQHIIPLFAAPGTTAFTVSDYTRHALRYYFPELQGKDVKVFYSPARSIKMEQGVENDALRRLISSGKPYLLMLAANRRMKNVHTLIKVYKRLLTECPELHLLTLKYGHSVHPQHIDISFLTDSDLEHAYHHAYALVFGSFFEGFGYPPIEAIKHGTPVVASNVTSIPEILGDAGIYFSPYYPADMYRAICQVLDNRNCRMEQIRKRYAQVSERQASDLKALIDELFVP